MPVPQVEDSSSSAHDLFQSWLTGYLGAVIIEDRGEIPVDLLSGCRLVLAL